MNSQQLEEKEIYGKLRSAIGRILFSRVRRQGNYGPLCGAMPLALAFSEVEQCEKSGPSELCPSFPEYLLYRVFKDFFVALYRSHCARIDLLRLNFFVWLRRLQRDLGVI